MRTFGLLFVALLLTQTSCAQGTGSEDVLRNALTFLGRPYVAHTLEEGNEERLVMNLDEVDCTTYVEYVLALTLAEGDTLRAKDYLRRIRYRDGVIEGYTSRLHYITEWIADGVRKGFFEDITALHGRVAQMKSIEQRLSGQSVRYLPKDKIPREGLPWIKNGDVLCITTSIPGLDVVHLGFAYYKEGKLHLLHASSSHKKVLVSEDSFADMFSRNKTWTGVRVLRINSSSNK